MHTSTTGMGEICKLFNHENTPKHFTEMYIKLLEKFEVALRVNRSHIIVPSLLPSSAHYPKPNDSLSALAVPISSNLDPYYQPPLRRFWFSDYVPDGFWVRLTHRIATDHQIEKVLYPFQGSYKLQSIIHLSLLRFLAIPC